MKEKIVKLTKEKKGDEKSCNQLQISCNRKGKEGSINQGWAGKYIEEY